jgi:hypothetical protein
MCLRDIITQRLGARPGLAGSAKHIFNTVPNVLPEVLSVFLGFVKFINNVILHGDIGK